MVLGLLEVLVMLDETMEWELVYVWYLKLQACMEWCTKTKEKTL